MKRHPIITGDVARIPLTQGFQAIVDASDLYLVEGYDWTVLHVGRTSYAKRNMVRGTTQKTILLHRVVMGLEPGVHVDHRDGDGLNCRRSNLRPATYTENNTNTRLRVDNRSGFKGVHKLSNCNRFAASITRQGVRTCLGYFTTAEEAHAAYCAASALIHKEFGRTA